MRSLENIKRVTYSNEIIMTLIKLYNFHGKEFYYTNILKSDEEYFIKSNIEKETSYLIKFFDLNVSENRLRLIITKDSEAKTNDEKIARNLKKVIEVACNNISNFEFSETQIRNLAELIFKDVKKVGFATSKKTGGFHILDKEPTLSKADELQRLFELFRRLVIEDENEITNLISNFFIDFLNIKPLKEDNEIIGVILIYLLLFKNGFTQFKYVSFFEILYNRVTEFKTAVADANYNWDLGFSKVEPLNSFIVKILLDNYELMETLVDGYMFDKKLNKTDNIENTILKAPNIFSKEDIKRKHPTVSKSTLDRTLDRLKQEGKIKPLGQGRSAKWIKVNLENNDFDFDSASNLFTNSEE